MPLGAFISSAEIMSVLSINPQLGHITTFGGHPVCCAAGLASLEVILEEDLIAECKRKSGLIKKALIHPLITEIRGEGLLIGVQVKKPEHTRYIVSKAPQYGIILDYFLFCESAFRIAPPLNIPDDILLYSCKQLSLLLDEAEKNVN